MEVSKAIIQQIDDIFRNGSGDVPPEDTGTSYTSEIKRLKKNISKQWDHVANTSYDDANYRQEKKKLDDLVAEHWDAIYEYENDDYDDEYEDYDDYDDEDDD